MDDRLRECTICGCQHLSDEVNAKDDEIERLQQAVDLRDVEIDARRKDLERAEAVIEAARVWCQDWCARHITSMKEAADEIERLRAKIIPDTVERMARAIYTASQSDYDTVATVAPEWERVDEQIQEEVRKIARAALKELSE